MYSIIGSWWCVLTYTPVRFQNAIYGLLKPAGGVMQIIIKTYNVNWASVHSSHTALDTPTPVPKDSYSILACWSSKAYIYMCTSVANDPKRNVFKARKMFYKVVQYTYIKDVPFTLHHLTKTKAKELLLLRLHTGLQESDLKKKCWFAILFTRQLMEGLHENWKCWSNFFRSEFSAILL